MLRPHPSSRRLFRGAASAWWRQPASSWSLSPAAKPAVNVQEALTTLRNSGPDRGFDETVDLCVGLGLDPRKASQNLRGTFDLPHGNGKKVRVAVFADDEDAAAALAAGAHVAGTTSLVESIMAGNLDFTQCLATPGAMSEVKKVARILGPRNMMPNPKVGTITDDVVGGVKAILRGKTAFRIDKSGFIHVGVGKVSFPDEHLISNIKAVMVTLFNLKPESAKGTYLKKATLSTTMGLGCKVGTVYMDPSSPRFLRTETD